MSSAIQKSVDVPLESISMKKVEEDAQAAWECLKRFGQTDLAELLGISKFIKEK